MKASLPIFLALVSMTFCHVMPSKKSDNCKNQEPETYCMSRIETKYCRKTAFCKNYLSIPICERGPEAYCKTEDTAVKCKKEEFCLTWPNDSVTAIKLIDKNVWKLDEHNSQHGYDPVINIYGIPIYTGYT